MFLTFLNPTTFRRQLAKDGEGGGTLPPSLQDLEDQDEADPNPAPVPAPEPPKDTDPDPKDPETKVEPEEPKEEPKPKAKDKDPEPPADDPDENTGTFWDDVDKLRGGDPIEVDYGDIDPESPEGALLRENTVVDLALDNWEKEIAEKFPDAYAYLNHLAAGGTKEDFFEVAKDLVTLPTEEQIENDPKLQEALIQRNMTRKGMSEKVITSTLKALKADDEMEEEAKAALKEEAEWEKKQIAAVNEQSEKAVQQQREAIKQISAYVDNVVATGEVDNLVIPEADRKGFAAQLKSSIRLEGGKWLAVTELNDNNIAEFFKKEFFGYKKGDLKSLVERQARTENTRRLVRTIPDKSGKTKGDAGAAKTYIPLGELDDE